MLIGASQSDGMAVFRNQNLEEEYEYGADGIADCDPKYLNLGRVVFGVWGTATSTLFWTISHIFSSVIPPQARRVMLYVAPHAYRMLIGACDLISCHFASPGIEQNLRRNPEILNAGHGGPKMVTGAGLGAFFGGVFGTFWFLDSPPPPLRPQ